MKVRIYVEDLANGGHLVDLFSSTTFYEWPVGWQGGNLILAGGPAFGGAPDPYAAMWYHLVDVSTGARLAVLGGPDCVAVGPLSAAGTACVASQCHCIKAVDWSGAYRTTYVYNDVSEFNWAALSPDGHAVLFTEEYGARTGGGIWRDGTITWLPGYEGTGFGAQWVDDYHTLVDPCSAGGSQCVSIQNLSTRAFTRLQAVGQVAGILPGGF
jgi:hypothetical protein